MATVEELQARLDSLLSDRPIAGGVAVHSFSAFRREDVARAYELVAAWTALDGEEAVLEAAEKAIGGDEPDAVRFALFAYLTHQAPAAELRVPPLAERFPNKVVPSVSPSLPDPAMQAMFET